ncbi:RHS repeat domain-containing protein [Streptomyces sp. NPDC005402]|uniref:RHS repeat domain-containing protein n=1 Tax=Streptomyces sp. NPDC005402 TaxID=3155338 RepID=UPI0033B8BF78
MSKGGVATTTLTDTLGRTTETRQYDNGTPTGSYTSIKYHYDAKSRLKEVVDDDGTTWSYGYDLMGRKITSTDPDTGTTKTTYTDLDQVATTTTALGTADEKTLSYTYDILGRKTDMYDGTTKGAAHELAKRTYDSVAKGQPTSAIRYVGGSSGSAYISQTAKPKSVPTPSKRGTATLRWDPDMGSTGHATIRVNAPGQPPLETEQVINGVPDINGSFSGQPTTADIAEELGPNTIERTFDLPDAAAARQAQEDSIDAELGPYDGITNSCVTYCVDILRAGGVDIPAGGRGMVRLQRMLDE